VRFYTPKDIIEALSHETFSEWDLEEMEASAKSYIRAIYQLKRTNIASATLFTDVDPEFMTSADDITAVEELFDDYSLTQCLTLKNGTSLPSFIFNEAYPVPDMALLYLQDVSMFSYGKFPIQYSSYATVAISGKRHHFYNPSISVCNSILHVHVLLEWELQQATWPSDSLTVDGQFDQVIMLGKSFGPVVLGPILIKPLDQIPLFFVVQAHRYDDLNKHRGRANAQALAIIKSLGYVSVVHIAERSFTIFRHLGVNTITYAISTGPVWRLYCVRFDGKSLALGKHPSLNLSPNSAIRAGDLTAIYNRATGTLFNIIFKNRVAVGTKEK